MKISKKKQKKLIELILKNDFIRIEIKVKVM